MIARAQKGAFGERLAHYRERVEARLEQMLDADDAPSLRLKEAMAYSVLGSGKRVRPLLSYAAGELLGLEDEAIDAIAASVELVHAYSLIHDDLPAMDDDDLRRGRPTTHRAFDEATAILAGDALQALSFAVLCTDSFLCAHPVAQVRVINRLAVAAGPAGMVGGQALDLQAEGRQVNEATLEDIHRRKTGELIRAAIMMPSELGGLAGEDVLRLDEFARNIGLAFQIRDDLLEVEQDTATIGKNAASDRKRGKSTYPLLLGADNARRRADEVYGVALNALEAFDERADGLRWLSDFIVNRTR